MRGSAIGYSWNTGGMGEGLLVAGPIYRGKGVQDHGIMSRACSICLSVLSIAKGRSRLRKGRVGSESPESVEISNCWEVSHAWTGVRNLSGELG